MNRFLNKALASLALAAGAMVPAHAIVVGGTEVGAVDTFLGACAPGSSGLAVELACINNLVNPDLTLVSQFQIGNSGLLSSGPYRAINVGTNEPGVFLLKFGAPGRNAIDSFVFQNLASLNFLVWNHTALGNTYEIRGISHYTVPSTSSSGKTPEPSTASLALLGLGLLGAGFVLRRRKTS